jgi:hypothetical protein
MNPFPRPADIHQFEIPFLPMTEAAARAQFWRASGRKLDVVADRPDIDTSGLRPDARHGDCRMRFSHWFRRAQQPASNYRPGIDVLEDRVVPVLLRHFPTPTVPPATHFQVIVAQDVVSGTAFKVIVEAEDAHHHIVPSFTGTVTVSLGTADGGAIIPATFRFTAANHGVHAFTATLSATGPQTIKTVSGALSGQAALTVDAPVTHFSVSTLTRTVYAGANTVVSVVALDANNQPVPGYTGTVHFMSTDLLANLPDDYTFTAADGGTHLFSVTFDSTGPQTVTVNDTATRTIVGAAQVKVQWVWIYYYPPTMYYGGFTPWGTPWY